ncbi:hypothetical protein [Alkalihalobacterium elongatum]|nr:hypothetical protein [Alkalihalobacterium elongatum]
MARAMIIEPSFIIADEPTSMLDLSVRPVYCYVKKIVALIYITHEMIR